MAFFDDISRKITQVGANAAGKTRDTADLFKLKGEIANEEDKLKAAYTEIGKLYYSLHSEDFEPQFVNLVANAKEAIKNIESCRAQIQAIKKITVCSKCGAEIPNENRFCIICGNPRVVNPGDNICVTCGKLVEAGNKFCIYCGTPVNVPGEVPPIGPVAVATETSVIAEAPVVSAVPQTPAAPVVSAVPQTPAVSEAPAVSESPAVPLEPIVPVFTETPVEPVAFDDSAIFELPENPVSPVETKCDDIRCTNCGNSVKAGNKFCIYCGTPVN